MEITLDEQFKESIEKIENEIEQRKKEMKEIIEEYNNKKDLEAVCSFCNRIFRIGDLIIFHESKDAHEKVYSTLYICKRCNDDRLEEIKLEELRKKEEERKANELRVESERIKRRKKYIDIIGAKVIDIIRNCEHVDVILDSDKVLRILKESDYEGGHILDVEIIQKEENKI